MKHISEVVLVSSKASSMLGFTWLRKTYQFFLPHKKRCSNTYCKYLYSFYPKIDAFFIFCENQQILMFRFSFICLIPKIIAPKYHTRNEKLFQNIYYTLFSWVTLQFSAKVNALLERILLNQITHLNREIGNISK